jgi:hypothetical protein
MFVIQSILRRDLNVPRELRGLGDDPHDFKF